LRLNIPRDPGFWGQIDLGGLKRPRSAAALALFAHISAFENGSMAVSCGLALLDDRNSIAVFGLI